MMTAAEDAGSDTMYCHVLVFSSKIEWMVGSPVVVDSTPQRSPRLLGEVPPAGVVYMRWEEGI